MDNNGDPTVEISLDELKDRTGGINPFEIPKGTDYEDSRIDKLTEQKFAVGIKLKLGLPSGVLLGNLPPIIDLGSSANNVTFNLLSSEFEIVQNNPPSGWGHPGSWKVVSQPSGIPWYFSTRVNLVYADLDKELNTPYFNKHPQQKEALRNQLRNLSGAFSLQQLLFDLDSAAIQTMPTIEGVPKGSNADIVLTKYFLDLYFRSVKEHGEPLLSVHAVANAPDGSSLRLTGMEREVGQFVDGNGVVVSNPTREQKQAVTLDYLCAANNHHLPGAASFDWNWVEPADIVNESGVIAINRNTLATYYKNRLIPHVRNSCLKAYTHTSVEAMGDMSIKWNLTPGQTPQTAKINPSGSEVLVISYKSISNSGDQSLGTYGAFNIHTSYSCKVYFSDNKITIVQNLIIYLKVRWDQTSSSGNIVDKTITDTYTLSVGQNGQLQTKVNSSTQDNSQDIDLSGFVNFFVDLNDIVDKVKGYANKVVATNFQDIPAADIQNFVFPGAKVFTYKDVQFSEHQDLVTPITYVTPS